MQVGGGGILGSWKGRSESGDLTESAWVNSLLVDPKGDTLYAGLKQAEEGAQLWRFDGKRWIQMGGTGKGEYGDWDSRIYGNVYTLVWHDGMLWAGLLGKLPSSSSGAYYEGFSNGEIYRFDGSCWERISGDGIRYGWDREHGTTWDLQTKRFSGRAPCCDWTARGLAVDAGLAKCGVWRAGNGGNTSVGKERGGAGSFPPPIW